MFTIAISAHARCGKSSHELEPLVISIYMPMRVLVPALATSQSRQVNQRWTIASREVVKSHKQLAGRQEETSNEAMFYRYMQGMDAGESIRLVDKDYIQLRQGVSLLANTYST